MNDDTSANKLAATSTSTMPGAEVASSVPEAWAVCCSGGGIRSASYCLGAWPTLEEAGFLDRAKLILGMSGGSYIAASRALVAHGLKSGMGGEGANGLPAYAPGSPEEDHLRDNTRHIAPDAKTLLAGVLSLLFGVAVTLVLVLTPVFAVVSQSARNTLTKYNLLKTPEAAQGDALKPGLIGTAVGYLRGLLLPWLASLLADANRISRHDFYRWRLGSAYAVVRETSQQKGEPAPFGTKDLPGAVGVKSTETQDSASS